jgi:translation elongation factor EF-4
MEIVEERLEREFGLELIVTAPSVKYRVMKTNGDIIDVDSPARLPDPGQIEAIEEPVITATILTAPEFVGAILQLCQDKRGTQKNMGYITPTRVRITYELPMAEVLLDFYDRLKSASKGYASLDYQITGWWVSPLVKLDVLVNEEPVDALSMALVAAPGAAKRPSQRRADIRYRISSSTASAPPTVAAISARIRSRYLRRRRCTATLTAPSDARSPSAITR